MAAGIPGTGKALPLQYSDSDYILAL